MFVCLAFRGLVGWLVSYSVGVVVVVFLIVLVVLYSVMLGLFYIFVDVFLIDNSMNTSVCRNQVAELSYKDMLYSS